MLLPPPEGDICTLLPSRVTRGLRCIHDKAEVEDTPILERDFGTAGIALLQRHGGGRIRRHHRQFVDSLAG
jgi:hypothetical protein